MRGSTVISRESLFSRYFYNSKLFSSCYRKIVRTGTLKIIDAFGQEHEFGNGASPAVSLRLLDPTLHHKLLLNPSLHFGEAYMNGDLLIESGGLKNLLAIFFLNLSTNRLPLWLRLIEACHAWLQRLQPLNSLLAARKNVKHHYDLSLEFYDLFLEKKRQYSCAYFDDGVNSLEDAQVRKMRLLVSKLLLEPGHHVLDIGCGWGGLSCYIAKNTGAKVTGITLSLEQLKEAKLQAKREGLEHLVSFELCDYRNVEGTFDRIVSVGMFEHVGANYYETFFKKVKSLLAEKGIMLLHSIGRSTGPYYTDPWIRKYIFPGGYIPALSEVLPHIENSGLYLTDVEILRMHYAKTLEQWRIRFHRNMHQARSLFDERFCRMWDLYLASSEASFEYLGNMVFHIQLTKQHGVVPITRDYLLNDDANLDRKRKMEMVFDASA